MKKLLSIRSISLLILILVATISVVGQNRASYPSGWWLEFGREKQHVDMLLNKNDVGRIVTLTVQTENMPGTLSYFWNILSGSTGDNIEILSGGTANTPYIRFRILNISLVGIVAEVYSSTGSHTYAGFLGRDY